MEPCLRLLVNVDSVHGMLDQLEVCCIIGAGNGCASGSVQVPKVLQGVLRKAQLHCLLALHRLAELHDTSKLFPHKPTL